MTAAKINTNDTQTSSETDKQARPADRPARLFQKPKPQATTSVTVKEIKTATTTQFKGLSKHKLEQLKDKGMTYIRMSDVIGEKGVTKFTFCAHVFSTAGPIHEYLRKKDGWTNIDTATMLNVSLLGKGNGQIDITDKEKKEHTKMEAAYQNERKRTEDLAKKQEENGGRLPTHHTERRRQVHARTGRHGTSTSGQHNLRATRAETRAARGKRELTRNTQE